MTSSRQQTGSRGEELALAFLLNLGYTLVTRNFRCRNGEIDLIMRDGSVLVFVEVRSKTVFQHGSPIDTIDFKKRRQIEKTARQYLARNKIGEETFCRFDVVGVCLAAGKPPVVEHILNAFMAGE